MKWRGRRSSSNIDDRRGRRVSRGAATGGLGTLVLVLVAVYFGMDPGVVLDSVATGPSPASVESYVPNAAEQELAEMIGVVLADTEDTWNELFRRGGATYQEPQLVLFTGAVESACGFAQAAMGPFYCGADRKVYIDLSFYQQLRERFQAPGDFAQAYVVAHEVGHHVQQLLGISDQVRAEKSRRSRSEVNALSVRQELQADCLAGVWAAYADQARDMLESGDIEEGLRAAAAIGDDNIQRQTQGRVVPESFTHGSSEQRVRWFRIGLENGTVESCDTFEQDRL